MALLTKQLIAQTGTGPTYAAATVSGDTCQPTVRGFLHVKNAGGSPVTVTIPARVAQFNEPGFGDIPVADLVVVVPATTGDRMIAIPPESHGSGGVASVTYSGVTSVTVAYLENQRL
jgi:hypothetical protein